MEFLTLLFFACAVIYSMAGFGGASTYISLMVVFSLSFAYIPIIALICNLLVVSSGVFHFYRAGHLKQKLFLPFIITSVPTAYIFGRVAIEKETLIGILGVVLLASGIRMLLKTPKVDGTIDTVNFVKFIPLALTIGTILGALSGLVGIGGGIFLAPILYFMNWGTAKEIAATASIFIFVNSLSGLLGQLGKQENFVFLNDFVPLFIAVFIGGLLGSRISSFIAPQQLVRTITAFLVIFVSVRLLIFT